MKKIPFKRILSVLLLLVSVIWFSSCELINPQGETTADPSAQSDSPTEPTTEKNTPDPVPEESLHILITSDTHYTLNEMQTWYGIPNNTRMQMWVNAVKAEHEKDPFDLIVINGDVSLDHLLDRGTYTKSGTCTTETFVHNFVSQLPEGVPVFILPGNHEKFNNEQWKALTGNERQGSVEIKGNLFIMVDTYYENLEPNYNNDTAKYSPADVSFIQTEMAKYPEDNVWLIGHYFSEPEESEAFKNLLRTNARIKGLFAGHTHRNDVLTLPASCGHKKIAETGNFSYTYYTTKTPIDMTEVANSFWGFRDLTITAQHAVSNYIIAEISGPVVNGKTMETQRRIVKSVSFY